METSIPNSAYLIAVSNLLPEYSGSDALNPAEARSEGSTPSVLFALTELDALTETPFLPRADFKDSSATRIDCSVRCKLGLFANIRPVATFDCLLHKSPLKEELLRGADFVVIRELTGGMYFGEKHQDNDMAFDTNIYTRPEIERILKVAFEMAMTRRKHLTVVDKANVLASSRLWRQIAKEMEPQYPEVTTDYMFIDNASMRVLTEPRFFDVIVTENTFGDILTDETSCITGSMGLQPSSSLGEHTPLFEPVHGSWPQAAGALRAQ